MNNKEKQAFDQIKTLLDSQSLGVLSTQKNDQPYASLVAFAATANLEQILFLTPNTTRKYDNLTNNAKVALLINNSLNQAADIYTAVAVTATGIAATVDGLEKQTLLELYLKKHPHLQVFSTAPSTALIRVTVDRYFMVSRFQNVIEVQVTS
ncbi:pyridoxamine 5'-phosphate oxidase family protein [Desulfobacula sp.]|uniref:pyridoxamine 5'-phosphate oxidase family protein n=1 Tax=Desulfobacula sp. TaxID=2593537 RepID=UPI00261933A1|nr:pyridoxamine 5'-phosphate oxidase family protein [Desulfobacula sp.]